jgi:sigma-B regulation protein RsbU (phosphoserine phosphatase)
MDLISRIHALDPSLPIVVMTAWGTVDLAVQAMRRGVCDFVQKPWDNRHLLQTLAKQVKHAQARRSFQNKMAIDRQRDTRLQREFVEARELQESLLTTSAPSLPAFELAMHWQPATTVGGDYVSAFKIDDNRVALCVADVVGKGLPAALLMSNFQAALKSLAGSNLSSSEVATRLNQQLYANTPLHKFVTAFYGVLDVSSRRLQFTNAGHNPPILLRANGEWRRLEAGGTVLGGFEAASFSEDIVDLRAGDRLLLFTDGLTEAVDESGEQFGEARLIQLLSQYRNCNAEQVKEIVFTAVANFCDDTFADDAALMVVAVS